MNSGTRDRRRHRALTFGALLCSALVAGLLAAGATADTAPSIASDKEDYAPGELVTLSGTGWESGEQVHINVNDDDGATWQRDVDVVADADGRIGDSFTLPDWFVALYRVTATGETSGIATTTFTDARVVTTATLNGGSSVTVSPSASIASQVSVTTDGAGSNARWRSTSWRIATTDPLTVNIGTCVDHPDHDNAGGPYVESFNITAPASAGTYNAYFKAHADDACGPGGGGASALFKMTNAVSVVVDTTAPVGSISINSGGAATNSTSVTLNLAATDAIGVTAYRVANGSDCSGASYVSVTPTTSYSASIPHTLSSGDGTKTVCAQYRDGAGNQSATSTDTIVLDTVKPTISVAATSPPGGAAYVANTWASQNVQVDFTCTDNAGGSGLATNTVAGQTISTEGTTPSVSNGGTCVDNAGNAADAVSFGPIMLDKTAPTLTASATSPPGGPAYLGGSWTNQDVKVAFECQDAVSGVATDSVPDVTVTTDGADQSVTSTGTCSDNAGNAAVPATFSNIDLDQTAPSASTTLDRGADHNGWYNAPVGHTTTGTDATSGIATCSSGTYSGPDGTGLSVSGTCSDNAGNSSGPAASALFKYDNTDPAASTTLDRGADHNGWYNAPVGHTTTGTDATSGIDECSQGTYSGPDGTGLSVSGSCTDNADNSSGPAASAAFDYDNTDPVVTTTLERAPDHNGWYNASVGYATDGTDATSGIDASSCTSGTYSGPDGEDRSVSGSCSDNAGNSASDAVTFDYDATAPSASTTLDRGADHNGWYNAPVGHTTTGTDATSGIATCSSGTYSGPDGTGLSVSGTCSDNAGNSSGPAASALFKYDNTDPAASTTLDRGADHNGWYNAPVGHTTTGTDATSGIDECSQGTYSGPDGTGLSVSGSCTDNADNSSGPTASAAFDYDNTDPVVTTTLERAPDHNGWYNASVGYATDGTDATSGIDASSCTSGTYSGPDGEDRSVSGSCSDNAGNSASDAVTFDYDATAPSASTTLDRVADHNGWYNAPVGHTTTGTDATSGIATCSSGTYSGPDGTGLSVSGTCSDNAGNSSGPAASALFKYDNTDPAASTTLDRGADHNGWYNAPVGHTTTGTDATSGIDECSQGTYSGPDGTGLSVSGSCTDNADNSSGPTASAAFDYDNTDPVVTTTLERAPDHNGWYNASVGYATDGTDATSGIDASSCTSGTYSGPDGEDRSVSGSCSDNAGNSASDAVTFDYDATAPSASTTLDRVADHNGWYNAPVGHTTTGTDATSGIATCSSGTYSGPDGTGLSVSGTCSDNAGNSSGPAASALFKYDNTDPAASTTLDRGADHNGWYNAPVGHTTTGTDATSGIDECSQGTYSGPDGTGLSVSGSCTDNADNSSGPTASAAFDYDNTDPVVSGSVSPNPVILNGSASATATATDNLSGVDGLPTCGPVDTSSVGAKTVSCSVVDVAGNPDSVSIPYSVIFNFHGFFQPVDNNGVFNVVNSGRAIPVKFDLSGNHGLAIFAAGYPKSTVIACNGGASTDVLEETSTAGNSSLTYSEGQPFGQYHYVWKTEKVWANTCRRLDLKLIDGMTYSALFKFTK